MKEKKERKILSHPAAWVSLFLAVIPVGIVALTQLITLQDWGQTLQWFASHPEAAILEEVVIAALCVFIYAVSGKLWLSALIPGGLLMALTLVSYYKTVINGTPLLLRDFSLAGQFWDIAGYALPQISVSASTAAALVCFFLGCTGLVAMDLHVVVSRRLRGILGGAAGAICIAAAAFTPTFTAWAVALDEGWMTQEERIAEYGAALGLYCTYAHQEAAVPLSELSDLDRLRAELELLPAQGESPEELPTVIFLMSESFFDVTKLPGVTFSEDPIPVFRTLAGEHTSGDFLSNTYCGGTGWVEMEVLTGICSNFLKESDTLTSLSGERVYEEMPSLAREFQNAGYHTAFLHAYTSELYNRAEIYPVFGFDDVLFMDSFPSEAENRGGYLSDSALTEKIISLYEEQKGEPMMLYAVSMENHQPYSPWKFGGETAVGMESDVLTEDEAAILQSYVTGLYDADRALGELVDYFEQQEEPVMLVFFGDHLPSLGVSEGETIYSRLGYSSTAVTTDWGPEELAKMLSTDYLIWTNYEEAPAPDRQESCTLLGLTVLNRIGLVRSPYFDWLSGYIAPEMLLYRPRLYVDAQGTATREIPEDQAAIMQDYYNAVYDTLYGEWVIFGPEND